MVEQSKAKAPIMIDDDLAVWIRAFANRKGVTMQSVGSNLLRTAINVLGERTEQIPGKTLKRKPRRVEARPRVEHRQALPQERRALPDRRQGDGGRPWHWTR